MGRMKFLSVIEWPDEVSTGKIPNESTDKHATEAEAKHVCKMLRLNGLGLEGKIFPLSTRIEEIKE